MPRTSDDTLGRRRFQLSRDQAVEAAIEKIRHAPSAEWHSFSGADYTRLRDILGELWISLERQKWDEYIVLHPHPAGYPGPHRAWRRFAGSPFRLRNRRRNGRDPLAFPEQPSPVVTGPQAHMVEECFW